jgi:K+/H+ antiporter YhaU regulatory subunit KhtT
LKGLYITLVGSGTYSTQVGNQISNLVIKDQTNATVATESSR